MPMYLSSYCHVRKQIGLSPSNLLGEYRNIRLVCKVLLPILIQTCFAKVTMWATIRPLVVFSAIVGGKFVHAALNDNGTQAIDPVSDEDASPIADINTYYPDQHDCPLPCTDYSNIHSWITYFSIERLRRCSQPM